jgi:hypothetical protein
MKKLHKIKVHSMEPSAKYEGKWVCQITLDDSKMPNTYWMSHKQMTSIQRILDKPVQYAAFDYEKEKPRFIWAASDKEWLTKAFIGETTQEAPQSFEDAPARVAGIKAKINRPEPPSREWTEDEIPF